MSIRVPGYVPAGTYYAVLAGTNVGWIIGTVLYHWMHR